MFFCGDAIVVSKQTVAFFSPVLNSSHSCSCQELLTESWSAEPLCIQPQVHSMMELHDHITSHIQLSRRVTIQHHVLHCCFLTVIWYNVMTNIVYSHFIASYRLIWRYLKLLLQTNAENIFIIDHWEQELCLSECIPIVNTEQIRWMVLG